MQQATDEGGRQQGLAMVYHALGKKAESQAALDRLLKDDPDESAFEIAEAYAYRGQSDEAMHWLERAYAYKDPGLYYLKGEMALKSLEGDPRFKAFLKKMKLPE
jgi:tetratricopeptide (TPR) repeat protein